MDPSTVLDQTVQDVSNLQAEFQHLLEEIRNADLRLYDEQKSYTQKEGQLQKFIKQHGSLAENPEEEKLSRSILHSMHLCQEIQQDKCILANTALFLVSKHLATLEKRIEILEEDGLLAKATEELDSASEFSRENSVLSTASSSTERKRKASSSVSESAGTHKKRRQQTHRLLSSQYQKQQQQQQQQVEDQQGLLSQQQSPINNLDEELPYELNTIDDNVLFPYGNGAGAGNEDEDKTLYCFCRSVSYGEMVACDGPNCKYEWFHYGCVNLKEPPKGAWYCPDCAQELARNKLKKKRGTN